MEGEVLLSRTDLSYGLCDGDAERGISVQDGDADLEFSDLTVEVPRHEPLAQQFHAVHLCFDGAPAVVSAPSSPERAAEVFRRAKGLVSGHGSGGEGLPRFGVLAGRNDGLGTAVSDGIVAFAGVPGTVGGDAADPLGRRDLFEQAR